MIEILVAIAVMAILAAALIPAMSVEISRARASAAQESLETIQQGITDFQADVGSGGQTLGYPATLVQLNTPLDGTDANICGDGYNGGQRNRWEGPYLPRVVDATGLPVGIGTAANTLVENGPTISIVVTDVVDEDALAMDRRVDDGDGATAGTIQWLDAGDGLVLLAWVFPFPGC